MTLKRVTLFLTVLILPLVVLWLTPAPSGAVHDEYSGLKRERIILKFKIPLPELAKDKIVESYTLAGREKTLLENTYVISVPEQIASEVARKLSKNFFVEYAEEDFIASKSVIPNDPSYQLQWGLLKIDAPGGWDVTTGSENVDIAIVDTGINNNHPDLKDKIVKSVNCTISSACPNYYTNDPDGHGTHVAGIASAVTDNGIGVAGLLWNGRLTSVKVLSDQGVGYYSWLINGIVWSADNGAEVINLSLTGSASSRALRDAVRYAWNRGAVVVAAAGNSGSSWPEYPAYYSEAIAVAATDDNDGKAFFSNFGSWVDVSAPGVNIISTFRNSYDTISGTSMSAPFVSGLAGLIKARNPGFSNSDIRNKIESSADSIFGTGFYWNWGRINVCAALDCGGSSISPSPTQVPVPTVTLAPTATPTIVPTSTPTQTPAPSPTNTPFILPTPTPLPSPTPTQNLPWWCKYIPWHRTCQ